MIESIFEKLGKMRERARKKERTRAGKPPLTPQEFVAAFERGEIASPASREVPHGFSSSSGDPLVSRRRVRDIADVERDLDRFANKRFGV